MWCKQRMGFCDLPEKEFLPLAATQMNLADATGNVRGLPGREHVFRLCPGSARPWEQEASLLAYETASEEGACQELPA